LSFRIRNADWVFVISFSMAFFQRSVPVSLSMLSASSTDFGTCIPNLCVRFQYLDLILDRILSFRRSTSCTHQLKAGSDAVLFPTAYSATCTGLASFKSLSGSHVDVPSFHSTRSFQPFVVRFKCGFDPSVPSTCIFSIVIAVASDS
jgi:hypothetical protein